MKMTDPPSIAQDGATVVLRGSALPLLYRATLALIARRSRDGLAAQPLLRLSRTTFYRACMSAQRRKGAAYHLAESRCNGQGRLANPQTYRLTHAVRGLRRSGRVFAAWAPVHPGGHAYCGGQGETRRKANVDVSACGWDHFRRGTRRAGWHR